MCYPPTEDELLAVDPVDVVLELLSELALELDHELFDELDIDETLEGVLLDTLDRLDAVLIVLRLLGVLLDKLEGVLLDRLDGLDAVLSVLAVLSVDGVELADVALGLDCVETEVRELCVLADLLDDSVLRLLGVIDDRLGVLALDTLWLDAVEIVDSLVNVLKLDGVMEDGDDSLVGVLKLDGVLLDWLIEDALIEDGLTDDKLDGVLLDWLLGVLLLKLCDESVDRLLGVFDDSEVALLGVLLDMVLGVEAEDSVLAVEIVLTELCRLDQLDSVELMLDSLIDCDEDELLLVLVLLVDVTDGLLTELWLLTDSEDADREDSVLPADALVAVDGVLIEDLLLRLWLLKDWLDCELLSVDNEELLTSDDGLLCVLPPVLMLDGLDAVLMLDSLSHSVARMYGAKLAGRCPVWNRTDVGVRFSPPAASVRISSHVTLSSSVTVRISVVAGST